MQDSFPHSILKRHFSFKLFFTSFLTISAKLFTFCMPETEEVTLDLYHQLIPIMINASTTGHTETEYNITPRSNISSVSHSFFAASHKSERITNFQGSIHIFKGNFANSRTFSRHTALFQIPGVLKHRCQKEPCIIHRYVQ